MFWDLIRSARPHGTFSWLKLVAHWLRKLLLQLQMGFVKSTDFSLSGWQRSDWLVPKWHPTKSQTIQGEIELSFHIGHQRKETRGICDTCIFTLCSLCRLNRFGVYSVRCIWVWWWKENLYVWQIWNAWAHLCSKCINTNNCTIGATLSSQLLEHSIYKEPDSTGNFTVESSHWWKKCGYVRQRINPFRLYWGAECVILHKITWFLPINPDTLNKG